MYCGFPFLEYPCANRIIGVSLRKPICAIARVVSNNNEIDTAIYDEIQCCNAEALNDDENDVIKYLVLNDEK